MESLLDLVLRLLGGDEELTKAYQQDPAVFADKYFGDLCSDDWNDLKLALDQTGIFEHNIDTGGNTVYQENATEPRETGYHGGHAVAQLQDIVNNYSSIDDRDTVIDQSTSQVINTGGGDFWQRIDNDATTASGDGAVAAGDDIDGTVNTVGHGDGNAVDNDGNAMGDKNVVDNAPDETVIVDDDDMKGHHNAPDHDVMMPEHDAKMPPYADEGHDIDDSFNNGASDSFNDADHSFNDADHSFNDDSVNGSYNDSISSDDDGVDDDSSTVQKGLVNVDDVLAHNNIPIDVNVDLPVDIL